MDALIAKRDELLKRGQESFLFKSIHADELDKINKQINQLDIEGVGSVNATVMTIVSGKDIIKNAVNLTDERRSAIKKDEYYDAFEFTSPVKGIAILDDESCKTLRAFNKAQNEARKTEYVALAKTKEVELEAKYPGIKELQKAYNEHAYYQEQFQKAMDNEYNDGVNMPHFPKSNIYELCVKYPRAAMYLKADSYSNAENYDKARAGDKAKKLLDDGGSVEDAQKILDNWLPESAYWD
ncbi:PTS mannose transporter subunit IIAB [Aggregatibacter actinomycetemcomitans serotype e str. SC936]|uniref:PTS mannose transporter subunit IIAB n=1 Tax=Aggregatibacter actinomycetemcomitans TaxID=714 RepID=UPI00079711CB|nr:PTS mannose transporter subunit IIAB [Aggregatibacter actinomycetemcomitans]KYK81791.1 PTS mannose transporter subunit IIAB [Aggregatibacter actinomycetemcomitans serotype e str. SC936]